MMGGQPLLHICHTGSLCLPTLSSHFSLNFY